MNKSRHEAAPIKGHSKFRDFKSVKSELDSISKTFCYAKWNQSTIYLQTGLANNCCLSPSVNIQEVIGSKEIELAKQKKQLREGAQDKSCSFCWDQEKSGTLYSERIIKSSASWAKSPENTENSGLTYLEVSFSNVCNLECHYCSIENSSSLENQYNKRGAPEFYEFDSTKLRNPKILQEEDNPYIDQFFTFLRKNISFLKTIRITGGEPLLHRNIYRLLEAIKESGQYVDLEINSNFSIPTSRIEMFKNYAETISNIKKTIYYVSLDCLHEKIEYIRNGIDFKKVYGNIIWTLENSISEVWITSTVTVLSISGITDLLQMILNLRKKYGVNRVKVSFYKLQYPTYLALDMLPTYCKKTRKEIESFLTANNNHFDHRELQSLQNSLVINEKENDNSKVDFFLFANRNLKLFRKDIYSIFSELRPYQHIISDALSRKEKEIGESIAMSNLETINYILLKNRPIINRSPFLVSRIVKGFHDKLHIQSVQTYIASMGELPKDSYLSILRLSRDSGKSYLASKTVLNFINDTNVEDTFSEVKTWSNDELAVIFQHLELIIKEDQFQNKNAKTLIIIIGYLFQRKGVWTYPVPSINDYIKRFRVEKSPLPREILLSVGETLNQKLHSNEDLEYFLSLNHAYEQEYVKILVRLLASHHSFFKLKSFKTITKNFLFRVVGISNTIQLSKKEKEVIILIQLYLRQSLDNGHVLRSKSINESKFQLLCMEIDNTNLLIENLTLFEEINSEALKKLSQEVQSSLKSKISRKILFNKRWGAKVLKHSIQSIHKEQSSEDLIIFYNTISSLSFLQPNIIATLIDYLVDQEPPLTWDLLEAIDIRHFSSLETYTKFFSNLSTSGPKSDLLDSILRKMAHHGKTYPFNKYNWKKKDFYKFTFIYKNYPKSLSALFEFAINLEEVPLDIDKIKTIISLVNTQNVKLSINDIQKISEEKSSEEIFLDVYSLITKFNVPPDIQHIIKLLKYFKREPDKLEVVDLQFNVANELSLKSHETILHLIMEIKFSLEKEKRSVEQLKIVTNKMLSVLELPISILITKDCSIRGDLIVLLNEGYLDHLHCGDWWNIKSNDFYSFFNYYYHNIQINEQFKHLMFKHYLIKRQNADDKSLSLLKGNSHLKHQAMHSFTRGSNQVFKNILENDQYILEDVSFDLFTKLERTRILMNYPFNQLTSDNLQEKIISSFTYPMLFKYFSNNYFYGDSESVVLDRLLSSEEEFKINFTVYYRVSKKLFYKIKALTTKEVFHRYMGDVFNILKKKERDFLLTDN